MTRRRQVEPLANRGDDPRVGLVDDEQVDLLEGEPGVRDDLLCRVAHRSDRRAEGGPAVHSNEPFVVVGLTLARVGPAVADSRHPHGQPLEARGRPERIENAVALGSDEPQTWFYLAEAILNSGGEDVTRAQQAARRALELAPDDPYVQTLAGRVELAQGNLEGAIGHLRRAIELLPTLAEAHVQLSRALSQAGRADEAAKEARSCAGSARSRARPRLRRRSRRICFV